MVEGPESKPSSLSPSLVVTRPLNNRDRIRAFPDPFLTFSRLPASPCTVTSFQGLSFPRKQDGWIVVILKPCFARVLPPKKEQARTRKVCPIQSHLILSHFSLFTEQYRL